MYSRLTLDELNTVRYVDKNALTSVVMRSSDRAVVCILGTYYLSFFQNDYLRTDDCFY